jgi:hypothetical protein
VTAQLIHRGLPRADRWVLIDLDPRVGFERRPERRDRNERDLEKLLKVRGAYLGIFTERVKREHPLAEAPGRTSVQYAALVDASMGTAKQPEVTCKRCINIAWARTR